MSYRSISRHTGRKEYSRKTPGHRGVLRELETKPGSVKLRRWFTFIRDNGGMNEQTTKVNLTSEYPDEVCSLCLCVCMARYLAWQNESIPREENCVHYAANRISLDNEIWKLTIPSLGNRISSFHRSEPLELLILSFRLFSFRS